MFNFPLQTLPQSTFYYIGKASKTDVEKHFCDTVDSLGCLVQCVLEEMCFEVPTWDRLGRSVIQPQVHRG